MDRIVVLLCGPPGSGKTTLAQASDLQVFDRDDEQWSSEREFRGALSRLAADPIAQAVVIRSAPTPTARAESGELVGATHTFMVLADRRECGRRITLRGRSDAIRTHAALSGWFREFDRADGVLDFPGWPTVLAGLSGDSGLGAASEEW